MQIYIYIFQFYKLFILEKFESKLNMKLLLNNYNKTNNFFSVLGSPYQQKPFC